jgi:teichuronic acid exporter
MQSSLRTKTIHGLLWTFIESAGMQCIRFAVGIILARLLFPEQFGLIAMITVFIAVAQTFLDSGFAAALIRKPEVKPADTGSIFYFSLVIGTMATGLMCLFAPWIAIFYGQPILVPLTQALSLNVIINSFGMVHTAILSREMNFKALAKANLIASALSGIIGVALAVADFGIWSLVYQQLSGTLVNTACLWHFTPWRPSLIFSFKSLKEMFAFGSRILASGILEQVFRNIFPVVIGKLFTAADVGYFVRAQAFGDLPSQTLSGIAGRVTFPVFASIQDDPARLKRAMKRALTTLALLNFPMMIGLVIIARPLVLTLLTEKWAESIPYLQLLSILMLLNPLHAINLNLLQALGKSNLYLQLEIIKKIFIVVTIAVTWQWGIFAMIYGMIALSMVAYSLNGYYTGILIDYKIREQLRDTFPYLSATLLMGVVVYTVGLLPFPSHWTMLMAQVGIGFATYACLCRAFRMEAFMEIWQAGWDKMLLSRTG